MQMFMRANAPLPLEGGGAGEGVNFPCAIVSCSPHLLNPPPLGEGKAPTPSSVCNDETK